MNKSLFIAMVDRYDKAYTQLLVCGANEEILDLVQEYAKTHTCTWLDVSDELQSAAMVGVDLSELHTVEDIDHAIYERERIILAQATEKLKHSVLATGPAKYLYRFIEWLSDKLNRIFGKKHG